MRPLNTRQSSAANARQVALRRNAAGGGAPTDENSVDARLTRSKTVALDNKAIAVSAQRGDPPSQQKELNSSDRTSKPEAGGLLASGKYNSGLSGLDSRRRTVLRDLSNSQNNATAPPGAGSISSSNYIETGARRPTATLNESNLQQKVHAWTRSRIRQNQNQNLDSSVAALEKRPPNSEITTTTTTKEFGPDVGRQERIRELRELTSKTFQKTGLQTSSRTDSSSYLTDKAENRVDDNDRIALRRPSKIIPSTAPSTGLASKRAALTDGRIEPPVIKKQRVADRFDSQTVLIPSKAKALAKARTVPDITHTLQTEPEVDWDDLDAEDALDPMMASEYVDEIFEYLYKMEKVYMPNPQYFSLQKEFNPRMRGVLMDWIIQVQLKFRLLPETLFLAANIIDRYFSAKSTELDQVQLIGIASLFIACKMEEVISPGVSALAYLAEGYTEEQIIESEKKILRVLNYENGYPNPLNFLRRISKADDYDVPCRTMGKYLSEISVVHHKMLCFRSSEICAAAMYLSRKILNRTPVWTPNLVHYSGGYTEKALEPAIQCMMEYLIGPVTHEEFFKKYASKRFFKSSIRARTWVKEQKRLEESKGGDTRGD